MLANDIVDDFEEFLRGRDRAADPLDGFADEARDLSRRLILNDVLHVVSTLETARRVFQIIRAAVTVAGICMQYIELGVRFEFPVTMSRKSHRQRCAAVITVA